MAANFFSRLKDGLTRTRQGFVDKIEQLVKGSRALDDDFYDELEAILVSGDVGVRAASRVVSSLKLQVRKGKVTDSSQAREAVKEELVNILSSLGSSSGTCASSTQGNGTNPLVIMVVGVNGVGKTTFIGKLAKRYTDEGKSVLVAAGDTFRAAAIEQLEVWATRAGAEIVKRPEGSDPASVAFEAVTRAQAEKVDVVIIDTAGRLHTKVNLMEELKKIRRIVDREYLGAPHQTYLVLDATTGQNAVTQARVFTEAVKATGIVLTKLDGTAKGGVVISIAEELSIPVKYIGVGEKVDDLQDFNPREFIDALFDVDS